MAYAFHEFVAKFPPVSMPATLGEETHLVFSRENEQLPLAMIEQFILPIEEKTPENEELIEYIPCFSIDQTEQFIALVWWKADLLDYEYVLATYTDKGQLISRKVIGFTKVVDGLINRAVATIDEDWVIFIAEGRAKANRSVEDFDPTSARTYEMEIMANGEIV
jgi:hypothetical protein